MTKKNDLILITAFCDTKEKEDVLRNLVNSIKFSETSFDILLMSHTVIPTDIANKCDIAIYDKKNELIYDWELRSKPWFNPNNDRAILSIFTGFFNTHLAIWRMIILGNSVAKNCGYQKVHHIEYDCEINDFSEIKNNSDLLNEFDCVTYTKTVDTVDNILFGTYQAYRLDTLCEDLFVLNEESILNQIRESDDKSPEAMLFELLHRDKNGLEKNKRELDKNNNRFGLSHNKTLKTHTAWCLPYFDRLTEKLGFIIWNVEENMGPIEVTIIYNDEKVINFGTIEQNHWRLLDVDDFVNAKKMTVLLNGKIRNTYDFEKEGEIFKKVSYREAHKKLK